MEEMIGSWSSEAGPAIQGPTRKAFAFWVKLPAGREPAFVGEGRAQKEDEKQGRRQIREGQSDQGLKIRGIGQSESGDPMDRVWCLHCCLIYLKKKKVKLHLVMRMNSELYFWPNIFLPNLHKLLFSINYGVRHSNTNLHEIKSVGSADGWFPLLWKIVCQCSAAEYLCVTVLNMKDGHCLPCFGQNNGKPLKWKSLIESFGSITLIWVSHV